MSFENISENISVNKIFEGYAEQLADEEESDFVILSENENFLEFEILGIPKNTTEPSYKIPREETILFVRELVEKLTTDYPKYQWKNHINLAGSPNEPASIYIDYKLLLENKID